MKWFKWWKDKTYMTILGIALGTMGICFVLAYFIEWGWIPAIGAGCLGGIGIRRVFSKKMDELADKYDDNKGNL